MTSDEERSPTDASSAGSSTGDARASEVLVRSAGLAIAALIAIVIVFIAIRLSVDGPHIVAGTVPDDAFAKRYVAHPWLGYLHILPGFVYLLGAPFQLSGHFRGRHYMLHRRLGRVLLLCALVSGVLGVVFGVLFAWGGAVEGSAAVIFGSWFVGSLVLAFRAIRRGEVRVHRRWMIRAFAAGIGIATIRVWVGIFSIFQLALSSDPDPIFPFRATFGLAFWIAFSMHVLVGEWWLRRTPDLDG